MSYRILRLRLSGDPGGLHCAGCELFDLDNMRCPYFGDIYAEKTGEHAGVPERPAECRAAEEFENLLDNPDYQKFLAEAAKGCRSADPPCDGCCAGGMCDGPMVERPSHFDVDNLDDNQDCDEWLP